MSKELIAKARKLSAAATPGPWFSGYQLVSNWDIGRQPQPEYLLEVTVDKADASPFIVERFKADSLFIAASRTLLPALADLAESEGKRAEEAERERVKSDAAYEALFKRTTTAINAMRTERDAALAELAKLKGQQS